MMLSHSFQLRFSHFITTTVEQRPYHRAMKRKELSKDHCLDRARCKLKVTKGKIVRVVERKGFKFTRHHTVSQNYELNRKKNQPATRHNSSINFNDGIHSPVAELLVKVYCEKA